MDSLQRESKGRIVIAILLQVGDIGTQVAGSRRDDWVKEVRILGPQQESQSLAVTGSDVEGGPEFGESGS